MYIEKNELFQNNRYNIIIIIIIKVSKQILKLFKLSCLYLIF